MHTPGPPLRPSGEEGRHLLERELLHGEYHRQHLVERVLGWLLRRLEGGVGAASGTSAVTTLVTMLVVAALAVGLALLLTRIRRDRRDSVRSAVVLDDQRLTAGELRARAEAAFAQGRLPESVADAFRALAVRQVERGRLADQPGATAREVAAHLASTYPDHAAGVGHSADLFDATLYGHHPVAVEDAAGILALDDALAGAR